MSAFDYGSAEAWEASAEMPLPLGGPQLVTIRDPESGINRNSNPEIQLRVSDDQGGALRDWVVITPRTIGKVAQLFDAAGVERPKEGEFNPETGELTQTCVDRLHGRKVAVMVHERTNNQDPMNPKTYREVRSYLHASQSESDIPAEPVQTPSASRPADEDDQRIPF